MLILAAHKLDQIPLYIDNIPQATVHRLTSIRNSLLQTIATEERRTCRVHKNKKIETKITQKLVFAKGQISIKNRMHNAALLFYRYELQLHHMHTQRTYEMHQVFTGTGYYKCMFLYIDSQLQVQSVCFAPVQPCKNTNCYQHCHCNVMTTKLTSVLLFC